jgi:hypothetical protein
MSKLRKSAKIALLKSLSEFIRRVLFEKPVTMYQRNKSLDEFMAEMMLLRNELNGLGNNFKGIGV